MAQLRRSKLDNHLYILAGQSQGTWQINEAGVAWLQSKGYIIPGRGESMSIEAGTFHRLKTEGYLDTHHLSYEQHDFSSQPEDDNEPVPPGLPLLLQWQEQQKHSWELFIDLSALADDVRAWAELRCCRAVYVSMNYAPRSLPVRLLRNNSSKLKVWPQAVPYFVQWEDEQHSKKQTLQEAPVTPGLNAGWQGNVFVERVQKAGFWQRYHPHTTLSFSGTVLWLAKTELHEPEWPGDALALGEPYMGWQLWRLEINDNATIAWEKVERWFSYRSIHLAHHHQHLQVISPQHVVSDDDWHISMSDRPVLIHCSPSRRKFKGISRQVYVSAETYSNNASGRARTLLSDARTVPVPADQISYFRWTAPRRGQYQINLEGDAATAEELLMKVVEQPIPIPSWLYGLSCTITSPETQQFFHAHAFKNLSERVHDAEEHILNNFAPHELPMLTWSLEPAGLPISIHWEYVSKQGNWQKDSLNFIESGETLTAYWQDRIWPTIATSNQTKITLDAGSFGIIELPFAPIQMEEKSTAWYADDRLVSQFIWLGRVHERKHNQALIALPASLRKDLNQLCTQVVAMPLLSTALNRLARIDLIQPWILVRLQMLINEISKSNEVREIDEKESVMRVHTLQPER